MNKDSDIQISFLFGMSHVLIGMFLMLSGIAWILSNLFQVIVYNNVMSIWTLDFLCNLLLLLMAAFSCFSGGYVRKLRLRFLFSIFYNITTVLFIILQLPRFIVEVVLLYQLQKGLFSINDNAPSSFMIAMYIITGIVSIFLLILGIFQTIVIKREMNHRGSKYNGFCDKIWEDDM